MRDISIKKATMINFISKYSNVVIQLVINSVLARLLTPNEFGIVAIITVFINFFAILSDLGLGPAIIQNKSLTNKEISDIFKFTFITAIIFAVLFIAFSFPLSLIYDNKIYISIGIILSISIFFNVINIVPNSIILRNRLFKSLAVRNIIISIIGGIITIVLAMIGAKYYALVINSVFISVATFIFNLKLSGFRLYSGFNNSSIYKVRKYSSYQLGFNFINYFSRNLDNLLIGKLLGPIQLGYYDKAYKLMLYPVQNLTHVITPVLHPILSDYQNNREVIYKSYIKLVKFLSIIGVFASTFCFFASKEIVIIVFGEKWISSVLSFKILSLSIWPQMISGIFGSIFQATGETKKMFNVGIVNTIITVILIISGIMLKSIEFVALGVVTSYYINLIISFNVVAKDIFNKKISEFYKNIISSIIILLIIILFDNMIPYKSDSILISVCYKFALIFIAYFVGLVLTREYFFIRGIVRK